MHESVDRVRRQISEKGGQLSAELFPELFSGEGIVFAEAFWPWKYFHRIFEQIYGSRHRMPDVDDSNGTHGIAARGFNVIPSTDGYGNCTPLCVTFASGGMRNSPWRGSPRNLDFGFSGAMNLLSAHWFNCLGTNKETLILTSSWNQLEFDELHETLIKSYIARAEARVFVVEVTKSGPFLRWPY